MTNDIQKQKPWKTSQIESTKPNAPRAASVLSGYIANSMNGGHNKVIAFKQVMAGEKHREYRLKANFQMLTPLSPAWQNLKLTLRTYFVPNSRVWKNAEKFTAQRGGATEIKIQEIPNLGGKSIPVAAQNLEIEEVAGQYAALSDTILWRDSFVSTYIPRMGNLNAYDELTDLYKKKVILLPKVSVLPLRGRIAIYNDLERNKEYDPEYTEYNGDTVSNEEWQSYLPSATNLTDKWFMRAKREDNYWTDYRTELQGFEAEFTNQGADNYLLDWAAFESKISEARAQAENAQKTDWEIIAEIRGSKLLSEGKVQLIGKKTIPLNYSAITQNTYNNNQEIAEEYRVMGKQGAYSYTEIDTALYAGMEFVEEGYIHVIATVSADSVFESGFDRLELNVNWEDGYRPDMQGDKKDVLYKVESGTNYEKETIGGENDIFYGVEGFKRKYSEYFKLPNIIAGDMTSNNYFDINMASEVTYEVTEDNQVETQKTFQFFETGKEEQVVGNRVIKKAIWKDYTDLLINKNQAIPNEMITFNGYTIDDSDSVIIKGQNQIFMVGVCTCIAELPINDEIKDNYTTWGEH